MWGRRYTVMCIAAKLFYKVDVTKTANVTSLFQEGQSNSPDKVTMTADEFKKRYMTYHKRLYQLAFVLTSDPHDAEDLLQDLYLKMWQIRDRIAGISNPEAFMATVMRRIFYDKVRSKRSALESLPLAEAKDVAASQDVAQRYDSKEEWGELEDFISELPPKEQEVIRMHILEDRNYKEIGSMTGLTPGSIRILVMRAKNKIKKRFKI